MRKSACEVEKIYVEWPPLEDVGGRKVARALLIEDDRTTRRMVSRALQEHCELFEASTASSGITSYNVFQPDIVFMDIELPDGDGYNLMQWMLRNDPGAFVVMFSGHSDQENIIKSANVGAKGFISKPFDLGKMMYFLGVCPKLH